MIRINLLPFREARKKENIRRQISIYVLSVLFMFAAMAFVFLGLDGKLKTLRAEKNRLQKELQSYRETTRKIKEIKEKIKAIRAKLGVIQDLEKKKTGPVLLLIEIAESVPRNRLWIRSLDEKKGLLTLKGTAVDNETVARFMTNLEKSKHITTVDLESSKLNHIKNYDVDVVDFALKCRTYLFKEKKPKTRTKNRRRKRR